MASSSGTGQIWEHTIWLKGSSRMIDWLIDWLIDDWLIDRLIDRLIDWLINWLID